MNNSIMIFTPAYNGIIFATSLSVQNWNREVLTKDAITHEWYSYFHLPDNPINILYFQYLKKGEFTINAVLE